MAPQRNSAGTHVRADRVTGALWVMAGMVESEGFENGDNLRCQEAGLCGGEARGAERVEVGGTCFLSCAVVWRG